MISIEADKELPIEVLSALADGTRAGIVRMLSARPHSASEIHGAFPIAAPAVSRHLRVLREAGVVEERRPENDRRVRLYALRPEPLDELATRLSAMTEMWQGQLDSFKDFVAVRTARPRKAS